MTLEISLAPSEEARLRERAAATGKDVQTFARESVMEQVDRPTLAELLKPITRHAPREYVLSTSRRSLVS